MASEGPGAAGRWRRAAGALLLCVALGVAIWAGVTYGPGKRSAAPAHATPLTPSSLAGKDAIVLPKSAATAESTATTVPADPVATTATATAAAVNPAAPSAAKASEPSTALGVFSDLLKTSATGMAAGEAQMQPPAEALAYLNLAGRTTSLLGLRTCYPKNGTEVERMVMGTGCTVIILTKGSQDRYDIRQTLVVNTTKIIIGHPLDLPVLNATNKIERLFDVHPGGYLDIRSVQLYKGVGRKLDNGSLHLIVGATVRVLLGGIYRGTEVIYREQRQTIVAVRNDVSIPNNRRRVFGGHVLVLGGNYRCVGCQTIRLIPYGSVVPNFIQVGRDALVVAGTATFVGNYMAIAILFFDGLNVGNNLAVFGGSLVWIGGGGTAACAAIGQFGAGQNLFVGGGFLFMVGYQDTSVFLNIIRAGFGQYAVGGGVYIMVGELENRVWGAGSVFNAGQAYSVGTGIMHMDGGEAYNAQISTIQAVAGGQIYLGSGDIFFYGFPFARFAITQAQYGCGMVWYNGAGTSTFVYTPAATISVVRAQILRGIELCMGYGMNTNVINTRWAMQVVNALIGGNEFFIGGGAAVFINVKSIIRRRINYRTTRAAFYVAGTEVIGTISREPIYVDKDGIQLLNITTKAPKRGLLEERQRRLPALAGAAARQNRSSLVIAQTQLDTVSGVTLNLELFKSRMDSLLTHGDGKRRQLTATNPLGGVSIVEIAKAFKAAFDDVVPDEAKAQLAQQDQVVSTATTDLAVARAKPERKVEIESVYVGGKDNQCFLCGVEPLPSSLHLPPPDAEGNAPCVASDACVAPGVARTAKDAMATAVDAAPEPLILPSYVKSALPLVHRKLAESALDPEDEPYPELPTINVFAYDVFVYCNRDGDASAPPTGEPTLDGFGKQGCGLTETEMKGALKSVAAELMAAKDLPFQLTAANSALHPAAFDAVTEEFRASMATPDVGADGCSTHGSRFRVFVTTTEQEAYDDLTGLFEAWRADDAQLFPLLADASGLPEERFCSVRMTKRVALSLPPLTAQGANKFYQGFYTALGGLGGAAGIFEDDVVTGGRRNLLAAESQLALWPEVMLTSPAHLAPVEEAVVSGTYTVVLQGFNTDLAGVEVMLFEGVAASGRKLAAVPKSSSGGNSLSSMEIEVTMPAALADPARERVTAYLRASHTGLPGIFAQSNTFTLRRAD